LAGRQWRAIGGAILSTTGLLLLGWIALGSQAYRGFLSLLSAYPGFITANRWPWHELASVFALLKYFGVPSTAALAIHAAAALTAAGVVWLAWREDREGKEAILGAATLLGSPYVLSYDAVLLALPTAWLLTSRPTWGVL